MTRREILALLGVVAFAATSAAAAQEPGKPRRIGFLGNSTAALEAHLVGGFRDGLRDLGYVEGRNIAIEYRWAEGQYEHLAPLIAELAASKVEIIVTAARPPRSPSAGPLRPFLSSWWRSAIRSAPASPRASHSPAATPQG